MQLVITEKNSVAQTIAAALGATKKERGYLIGNGYAVSWCVGHLVELARPQQYDERYAKWRMDSGWSLAAILDRITYVPEGIMSHSIHHEHPRPGYSELSVRLSGIQPKGREQSREKYRKPSVTRQIEQTKCIQQA